MSQDTENQQQEIRPSGETFSFDVILASHYGIEEALLIRHFQYWIRINKTKGTNFIDERTWTYQTMKEIAAHFPFMNYEKVKYAIENLILKNIIQIGNYNKSAFDKTNWYSFVREDIFVPDNPINSKNVYERETSTSKGKLPHGKGKPPEPIPDTIPNTKSELIDSDAPLPSQIEISDFDGKKRTITIDDIYFMCAKNKYDWKPAEIIYLYKRLAQHKGNVRSLTKFCEKIISQSRLMEKINKGEKTCKKINQNQSSLPVSKKQLGNSNPEIMENDTLGQRLQALVDSIPTPKQWLTT